MRNRVYTTQATSKGIKLLIAAGWLTMIGGAIAYFRLGGSPETQTGKTLLAVTLSGAVLLVAGKLFQWWRHG